MLSFKLAFLILKFYFKSEQKRERRGMKTYAADDREKGEFEKSIATYENQMFRKLQIFHNKCCVSGIMR